MSSIYPYSFDNISRIGFDTASYDQRNIQNVNSATYLLENYYPACPMTQAVNFATNQPNVFYKGAKEGGIKGCEMDASNELKFTHITKPACKLNLVQRPFLTVPFLGRGLGDVDKEFELRSGEALSNRKTSNRLMENDFTDYKNYPLLDTLRNTHQNSAYKIESDAMDGWIRGGMSAREYAKINNKY